MGNGILITGASGLIGQQALNLLHSKGFNVTGLDLFTKKPAGCPCPAFIQADLRDKETLKQLTQQTFDILIHCASVLPDNFFGREAQNAALTNSIIDNNVLSVSKLMGCRFIYLSGTSVYGNCGNSVITEEININPSGPYAAAKADTEKRLLDELNAKVVILRVNAPYGVRQKSKTVLRIFIENVLNDLNLRYHGSGTRQQDFTEVNDVANAIFHAVSDESVNGIFNISGGNPITMFELAKLIVNIVPDTKSSVVPSGQPDPQEGYTAVFDITKARKILGWYPLVSLEEGILRWIDYLRRNNDANWSNL